MLEEDVIDLERDLGGLLVRKGRLKGEVGEEGRFVGGLLL